MRDKENLLNSFKEFYEILSRQSEASVEVYLSGIEEGLDFIEDFAYITVQTKKEVNTHKSFTVYFNLGGDFYKEGGFYEIWGTPSKVKRLEDHFSDPLNPASIELEEFFLEKGFHYPVREDYSIVDPVTGKPFSKT